MKTAETKERKWTDCGIVSKFEYDISDLSGNLIQKVKSDFDIKIDDVILLDNDEPCKVRGRILSSKYKDKCTLIVEKKSLIAHKRWKGIL